MALVSVIIPAFNQARFVRQAVRSALDQTHPWVEVIVVNDGSTDDTGDVLREFAEVAMVTTVTQANAGLPAARNRGLTEARGEFVCFLDSDDFLASSHIERLLEPLAVDPALSMAYCDVQFVNAAGEPAGDIFESLLVGGYFPPHTMLVRKSAIDEAGAFQLDLGGHADYELWMRLAAGGHRAHYVDEKLANYRVYDGSMSKDREHMRRTRVDAIERVSRQFPARTASAISAVQELASDLFSANAWLRQQWSGTLARLGATPDAPAWILLDNLDGATLASGETHQLKVWQVADADRVARCVYLHPPAALKAVVPTGAAGTLTMSVGLHPDVWTNPGASGCVFSVNVDDVVVSAVALDPLTREGDRRWVSLNVDVPASASGHHAISLETQVQGTGHFAWGLFRDVQFRAA
jgi:hypothetical protein